MKRASEKGHAFFTENHEGLREGKEEGETLRKSCDGRGSESRTWRRSLRRLTLTLTSTVSVCVCVFLFFFRRRRSSGLVGQSLG